MAVVSSALSQLSLLLLLFVFANICSSQNVAAEYLRLPLLHKTPFPSPSQLLSRDAHRLSILHGGRAVKSPVVSGASTGSGQYFVDLHLGSPPQRLLLIADTGSDLVWVRCSACKDCANQNPGSAFLARHSGTFSPHHCYDAACRLVPHPDPNPCNRTRLHSPCRYEYSYADLSTTSGFFSRETTTLNTSSGKLAKLRGLAFGCGFRSSGASFNGANGVMGLGRGPISFSSQLAQRFGNKFSYCLMDYTIAPPPTSYLVIGDGVVSKAPRMSFTPLQTNPVAPTFYYIGIEGVSVGGVKLRIDPSVWAVDQLGNGGTVIDSGTTLTFLPRPAYRSILAAFRRLLKEEAVPAPPGGGGVGFDLCVNVSSKPRLPRLSFRLAGNTVLSPPPRNYFIETAERVRCLAIQPVNDSTTAEGGGSGFGVIGNLMQQGFLLEFDSHRSRLGFSRRGCAVP